MLASCFDLCEELFAVIISACELVAGVLLKTLVKWKKSCCFIKISILFRAHPSHLREVPAMINAELLQTPILNQQNFRKRLKYCIFLVFPKINKNIDFLFKLKSNLANFLSE